MSKYIIKEFQEIFSDEFVNYIDVANKDTHTNIKMIFDRIEKYEAKHNIEFVTFYGAEYVIFKPKI